MIETARDRWLRKFYPQVVGDKIVLPKPRFGRRPEFTPQEAKSIGLLWDACASVMGQSDATILAEMMTEAEALPVRCDRCSIGECALYGRHIELRCGDWKPIAGREADHADE